MCSFILARSGYETKTKKFRLRTAPAKSSGYGFPTLPKSGFSVDYKTPGSVPNSFLHSTDDQLQLALIIVLQPLQGNNLK